jgi:hypothetical protein
VQMDVWHFMCLRAHPPKKARFFAKTVRVRLFKEFIADLIMHLTNSSLAVHMLKILIAEDCFSVMKNQILKCGFSARFNRQ